MKTEKKNNSAMRKLIPAASMLLVSTMMLASSTYAWFTMNKEVEVTGMEVRTKVGDNLLICTTNMDADYSANTLIQERKALLEPVSSINGTTSSFFYTTDAKANGQKNNAITGSGAVPYVEYTENQAQANAVAGKPKYDSSFNTAYGLSGNGTSGTYTAADVCLSGTNNGAAYGYVDYVFYVKGTSNKADQKIVLSQCDIDYDGSSALNQSGTVGVDIDRAWRVAVFSYDVTSANPGTGVYTATDIAATEGNQKGLINLAGAAYFGSGTAVDSTSSKGSVVNKASSTSGVVIGGVGSASTPAQTKYYKVVVRLWLEGEDTTCNSKTYAALTKDYSLDLKLELVDDNDSGTKAVDNISTNAFDANRTHTQNGNQYDTF